MEIKSPSYADLLFLRNRLDKEHSELLGRLQELQEQMNAVNVVLALLRGEEMPISHSVKMQQAAPAIQQSIPTQEPLPTVTSFYDSLKGKTQLEAMKLIARSHGGKFRTAEARRIMLRAGLIKNPKNAAPIIFNVLKKSDAFRRVAPGVYELLEPQRGSSDPAMKEAEDALTKLRTAFGA